MSGRWKGVEIVNGFVDFVFYCILFISCTFTFTTAGQTSQLQEWCMGDLYLACLSLLRGLFQRATSGAVLRVGIIIIN